MYRINSLVAIPLAVVAGLPLPAQAADTIKSQSPEPQEAALLLPGIQKVREAAAREPAKSQSPAQAAPETGTNPTGLLLPAVQKARRTRSTPKLPGSLQQEAIRESGNLQEQNDLSTLETQSLMNQQSRNQQQASEVQKKQNESSRDVVRNIK